MGNLNVTGKGTLNGNPMASFPIGGIYLSYNNTSPAELFGGTWEPIEADQTLWTTTTAGEGGTPISAGLPNITGTANRVTFQYDYQSYTGALKVGSRIDYYGKGSGGSNFISIRDLTFNADDGATTKGIYGNSTTVQPPAVKIYAWHRVA